MSHHGEVNDADDWSRPVPPLHRKCRCIEQPYLENVSPKKQPRFGAMREWLAGEAAAQTAWTAKQLTEYRTALLGKGTVELLDAGKIDLEDIITKTHERTALRDIKRKHGYA